ncbi:MAG: bifunctional adenosylcobinamide kinase/adenosylcobinamide-phosphate guanylyltransferase [Sneathiellales bacterium]|nr:bifunctional adenosylcobinamide kinase/adenosylcobinamide-phosphate guanylyltransferase [Sneathiellales bacterium]
MALHFLLGGTRSGKSRLAETLAASFSADVAYIATATAGDDEMLARIEHHKQSRPANWKTIEEPLYLSKVIEDAFLDRDIVLVDCLTLWICNLMCEKEKEIAAAEQSSFLTFLQTFTEADTGNKHLILVSNETNMGVIPMDAFTREYCDIAGRLHQNIAEMEGNVILAVAGLPHVIKGNWLLSEE